MNVRRLGPIVILSITLVGSFLLSSQFVLSYNLPSGEATAEVLPLPPVPRTYPPSLPTSEPVLHVDPAEYRIVFVAPNPDPSDRFYAADGLLATTSKAAIAMSWDDVRQLDAIRPVEALIVHSSALEGADIEWTSAAARRGVTLVLLNMYVEQMAVLRDSACTTSTISKYPDRFKGIASHYFLAMTLDVRAVDPAEQDVAVRARFDACYNFERAGTSSRGSQSAFEPSSRSAIALTNTIISHIEQTRRHKQGIERLRAAATATNVPAAGNP